MTDSTASQEERLDSLGLDLKGLANGLPGGFFVYEAHGDERILFANDHMAELFGCADVDEFLSYVGGTFPGLVHPDDCARVREAIWKQVGNAPQGAYGRDHVTYRVTSKDGKLHYLDEYGRLVRNSAAGDVFFVFVVDVTSATGVLDPQGNAVPFGADAPEKDELTGLPTMRSYHMHSAEVLAEAAAQGKPMASVFIDIDHFRTINYRLGYEGGDEVLQCVGSLLQEAFPDEFVARFSDGHFVLLVPCEGLEERLQQVHDRIAQAIAATPVEIKAGVYELAPDEVSIPFAHDRAKVACSSIKGRYDRCVRFYDESLAVSEDMRDYVVNNIDRAINEGWIHIHYQPIVRVSTRRTCGVEALSRWVDPVLGMLSPAQYVGFLEEARLIHLLDSHMIATACADVRRTLDRIGTAVPVSLNFSPSALAVADVPQILDEQVRLAGIPRELVHVEITESSLADDPGLLRSTIQRLHELGYEAWMDDFGSGYSSLNLLKDFDFDVLKADMVFLRGMEGNDKSKTILTTITQLAHDLGMKTLVEGVETEGQFAFLRAAGADCAQGFLFSEPVPYDAIIWDFFLRYPPEMTTGAKA
jgi:diguanylate cyclase (GGDEF)-like protein